MRSESGGRLSRTSVQHTLALTLSQSDQATIYGGRYTFLTVLSLAATLVSFVFALLLDAFPRSMVLRDIKTATQIVLVPVQGVVTVLYWGELVSCLRERWRFEADR